MTGENSQNIVQRDHDERSNGTLELARENAKVPENFSVSKKDGLAESHVENEDFKSFFRVDGNHDQLTAMIFDLTFQNAYLKVQFDGFRDEINSSVETFRKEKEFGYAMFPEQVKQLQEKIEKLNKEIKERKETEKAADNALEHLKGSFAEADARIHELVEVQQRKEKEIKERDEKYVELDTKFQRLHKRAKQRIQELTKEKDDLEGRSRDLNQTLEKASSQQSSMQQELERTKQQANEALRLMDAERQQLRTTNNKLRDNIDEMHRLLEAKETTLEELRQSLFAKEQMFEETKRLLQAAEERKQTSIADISGKHQKVLESLEAQLAEALLDRNKAAESISSLQVLIGEKDSKIAELEAASSGEAVRFGAAIEAARAETAQLKNEHGKEKEHWDAVCQALKTKLENFESACLHSEIEAAKSRSQFESELSLQGQLLRTKDSELLAVKEEMNRLESEFASYKVRAHALLQKKEAELEAGKDSEMIKAQEEAIREAEKEIALVAEERDRILNDLKTALLSHKEEISTRDAALVGAEQQNRDLTAKFDSLNTRYLSEKQAWQKNIDDMEQNWRLKYNTLESQKNYDSGRHFESELQDLKIRYDKLKGEHDTFRDIAERMLQEREKELSKLSEENENLLRSLETKPSVNDSESLNTVSGKLDSSNLSIASSEQQILLFARQQAQREEELAQSQRHILALQDEIEELERENRLHSQQEAMLKEALRETERKQKREGVDMTYLKNVILKLLETGEVEVLLPVIAMLLQFSPEEARKCQQAYRSANDA